ncbi:MAG: hypothetical protein CL846_00015 [Crocinitomicaceae bacterium]|nr:hypothetical protein [Crocinitomicaceae bacterium]|tara:strand:+ start:12881 stop:14374 length:1494 start_codon:yes stop_codon:yes gene_type:complete
MKKNILLFFCVLCISFNFNAQQKVKFHIDEMPDDTIYLARYFGERLYYADTAVAKNETVIFNKKELTQGVYALVCPGPKYFEFIMSDEDVEMSTKMSDFIGNMKVIKSENNKIFYEYITFLNDKKKTAQEYQASKQTEKLAALDKEVKAFQQKIVLQNKDKLGAKILAMSIDPILPENIKNNDTLKYRYFVDHYWDNIDVTDKRIVHSPVYHNKLSHFFKKMIPQHPDTICYHAHKLINQMDPNSDLFKYTVHFITYNYETSNIMGMDAVFVCMAQKYYCPANESGAFWLDSTKLVELCDKAYNLSPLLIGEKAPRIILADTSEKKWVDFYQNSKKYNLLVFWDPDCGHCKKEIPKLLRLYHDFKTMDVDLEIFAFGTNLENDDWRKFISDKNLDWINLSDFPEANENPRVYLYEKKVTDLKSLNFRKTYDIFSTPQVYLLDSEKKIIGKRLDALTLGKMVEHLENIEINYVRTLEEQDKKDTEERKKKEQKNESDH